MMATENSNLTTPVESVGIAEDVQNVTSVESANVNVVAEDESQTENVNPAEVVDFAEEDAALAAQQAGLSLDDETAEEQAAEDVNLQDLNSLSKEQLVELFATQL